MTAPNPTPRKSGRIGFSQITMNWRGRPLTTHQVIVDLIANTTTATGLRVQCVLDTRHRLLLG